MQSLCLLCSKVFALLMEHRIYWTKQFSTWSNLKNDEKNVNESLRIVIFVWLSLENKDENDLLCCTLFLQTDFLDVILFLSLSLVPFFFFFAKRNNMFILSTSIAVLFSLTEKERKEVLSSSYCHNRERKRSRKRPHIFDIGLCSFSSVNSTLKEKLFANDSIDIFYPFDRIRNVRFRTFFIGFACGELIKRDVFFP